MNIKKIILDSLVDGDAKRDENNNVTFELFGKSHNVRVTDDELAKYKAKIAASVEQAEQEIADAESAISTAKALIKKHGNKKD